MKRFLIAIVSFFFALSSFAQHDGFRIGYGMVSDKGFDNFLNELSVEYFGFIHIDECVKIQPALELDVDFKKQDGVKLTMVDIALPVNVDFQFPVKNAILMPYMGLHVKYYVSGQSTVGNKSVNIFSESEMGKMAFRPLQFGCQAGFDVIVNNFIIGIGGDLDLTKFNEHLDDYTKKLFVKVGMVF